MRCADFLLDFLIFSIDFAKWVRHDEVASSRAIRFKGLDGIENDHQTMNGSIPVLLPIDSSGGVLLNIPN